VCVCVTVRVCACVCVCVRVCACVSVCTVRVTCEDGVQEKKVVMRLLILFSLAWVVVCSAVIGVASERV